MEFTVVEGLRTLKLDLVFTLALAALSLFAGTLLQRRVRFLGRASIPAAAVGGLLFASVVLALRARGTLGVALDTSLRAPLQTAFFTTIGFGATLTLLRTGGWRMAFFLLLASLTAVVQNVAGIGVARALGAPAALGVICGSLTLTGGPATGLAFTALFEQMGIAGAGALIIASATFGIFVSSIVGNPIATILIRRFHLAKPRPEVDNDQQAASEFWAIGSIGGVDETDGTESEGAKSEDTQETPDASSLLRHLLIILGVMGAGALAGMFLSWLGVIIPSQLGALVQQIGGALSSARVTNLGVALSQFKFLLPGYIGAMIVAALVRNTDDRSGWLSLNMRAIQALGIIALALFLVIALMDLKLWQLAGLAVPMLVILLVQVVLTVAYAVLVTFTLMGRDYEAAVTASGHIGFGLGITPNAVANMEALVERYGPAPRSFLVVPVVGAFFIDFTNALVITTFANLVR